MPPSLLQFYSTLLWLTLTYSGGHVPFGTKDGIGVHHFSTQTIIFCALLFDNIACPWRGWGRGSMLALLLLEYRSLSHFSRMLHRHRAASAPAIFAGTRSRESMQNKRPSGKCVHGARYRTAYPIAITRLWRRHHQKIPAIRGRVKCEAFHRPDQKRRYLSLQLQRQDIVLSVLSSARSLLWSDCLLCGKASQRLWPGSSLTLSDTFPIYLGRVVWE